MAALVACLLALLPLGALWTVKILPMYREPPPADPPAGNAVLSGPEALLAGSAELRSGWLGSGT